MQTLINSFIKMGSLEAKRLQDREKLIQDIEYLSGYRLETLKDMFAAGWTLSPPPEPMSMEDLINEWRDSLTGNKT